MSPDLVPSWDDVPVPVVDPDPVDPYPHGSIRYVVDINGVVIDAPAIIEAAESGPGRYRVTFVDSVVHNYLLTITDEADPVPPAPVPVPPGPGPAPVPPPVPVPPVPVVGPISVLVVYETDSLKDWPVEQRLILTSTRVREYLDRKCEKVGGIPNYRFFDDDRPMGSDPVFWQEAMKKPRASDRWLVVSNGVSGASVPLPKTEAEFLALLKTYGGE